jgi:cyclic beta-1,2-glucan synthetase
MLSEQTATALSSRELAGSKGLEISHLEALSIKLAQEQPPVSNRPGWKPTIMDRLEDIEEQLEITYEIFVNAAEEELATSHACEWMLDNIFIIRQSLRLIREDMPRGFYQQLPKLDAGPLEGYPRVYRLTKALATRPDMQLGIENIQRFVTAYQQVKPLTTGELWALPVMLRFSVLEFLSQATLGLTASNSDLDPSGELPIEPKWNNDTLVANAILNLRTLSSMNWMEIVENLSFVERALKKDPAGIYSYMDVETRNHYRRIVEEIALATNLDEERIALEAISLAQTFVQFNEDHLNRDDGREPSHYGSGVLDPGDAPVIPREAHVGFYLIDVGRKELEDRLGLKRSGWAGLIHWFRGRVLFLYLGAIALLTCFLMFTIHLLISLSNPGNLSKLLLELWAFIPILSISVNLVNWLITLVAPMKQLPKMDFREGIPNSFRTIVVIPCLLCNSFEIDSLLEQIELHFLSNRDPNLYFALLTDFTDAPQKEMPTDKGLLEKMKAGIQNLNEGYSSYGPGRFSLFHRERLWNPSENLWMGWERKRGKLAEFNRLMRGAQDTSYVEMYQAPEHLDRFRYVITLDRDTLLPDGNGKRLVGTLAHPLNQAQMDPETKEILSGYTILQPRVEIQPTSANQTPFTRIFSTDTALDLYSRAVSDVYQDLFGEGIFVGKGIYEIDSFESSLKDRVPENALLSHDLFEGIHGRVGLVTDITLLEDFPPHYLAFAQRLHRWLRGDWQILPWLFRRVPLANGGRRLNHLSLLSRWKIFDNLRRSLLSPTLFALWITSWLFTSESSWFWSLFVTVAMAIPLITKIGNGLNHLLWRKFNGLPGCFKHGLDFYRWLLAIAFLPFEALTSLHAISSTLYRLMITKRSMLQWTASTESAKRVGKWFKPEFSLAQMAASLVFSGTLGIIIAFLSPQSLVFSIPFLFLWMISPQIAHWISQPILHPIVDLSLEEHNRLRRITRRTWLFFEEFVGPEDHWLPPDHFQEDPLGLVAHRTSPTNIGLLLLSTLAAYDLGYVGLTSLAFRLNTTLDTIDQLDHHRGHILNWYDTRTLQPLSPRYVSTVDSGNLAASLLVLKRACAELPQEQILRWERWQGLLDVLSFLTEVLEDLDLDAPLRTRKPVLDIIDDFHHRIMEVQHEPGSWSCVWTYLSSEGWENLSQCMKDLLEIEGEILETSQLADLRTCNDLVHVHLFRVQREVDMLSPWLSSLNRPPSLFSSEILNPAIGNIWAELQSLLLPSLTLNDIPAVCKGGQAKLDQLRFHLDQQENPYEELSVAREWCLWLSGALEDALLEAETLLQNFKDLEARVEREFDNMDFSFLFNKQRQVFHIGYHVETGRLDDNFYDLLASEARLASIIAMAKQDVPQSHWLHLSRPITMVGGMRVLLSWSGTMFEYLMPNLVAQDYENTLLSQSNSTAIDRQMSYGAQHNVPWGISESGYYAFDTNMFYQYRAFGVPGLGYKRGLAEDLVITPYASILALPHRPKEVLNNIQRLCEMGMQGRYGFYEAIDFTHARLTLGHQYAIVHSYMAHHQGMILLACSNYLLKNRMVARFHSDPRIKGVELLLQERIPYDAPVEEALRPDVSAIRPEKSKATIKSWSVPVLDFSPQANFLSNGRYSLMITSSGAGFSRWDNIDLTRWRADTTLENWGSWIYIKDQESEICWSMGYQPRAVQPQNQNVSFEAHKAEFWRQDGKISSRMEVTVTPDDDVEIRHVRLTNQGSEVRRLFLTSYAEVILAAQSLDRRHPAFNKLFIECEYLAEYNALLFRRRPGSAEEEPIYLAHVLVREPGKELTPTYETDREGFIGRGRTIRDPAALAPNRRTLSNTSGPTLDPIMALGQELTLAPGTTEHLAWITLAASGEEEALSLIKRYTSWPTLIHSFDRAQSQINLDLRQLDFSSSELECINRLLSALFYPNASSRVPSTRLAANRKGQPGLWPFTISGDYPILLLIIGSQEETPILLELLRAHAYWRKRQIKIDLVILNEYESGYSQDLTNHLFRMISRMDGEEWLNRRGGIFLLRADQMEEADRILLETASRVVLYGKEGSISEQLAGHKLYRNRLPDLVPTLTFPTGSVSSQPIPRPHNLLFDNGIGGFSPDGREYVIYLRPGQHTPSPWVNVISNPDFGFLISEAGVSNTWARNSAENRLTPWNNDPVSDTPGEVLYLRDEETGAIWSPTPLPAGASSPHLIRHGAGYSIFEHHSHDLHQELKLYVSPEDPVKVIRLKLQNTVSRNRRITATYFAEWVLGTDREQNQMFIIPHFDNQTQAMLAHNPYNTEFANCMAFLAGNKPIHGLTCDRSEFLGRMWSYKHPSALNLIGLSGIVQAGTDPCAAITLHIDLAPHESEEIYFILGQGEDWEDSLRLIERYQKVEEVNQSWDLLQAKWDAILETVQVKTPDKAMDLLLNRWLLYQALSSRFWGRTAFYQSSGAFGFRDQLQDVMAFIHTAPELARQHLLESARRQFEEGDVLHWWHLPSGRGVRTKISDDLLWLPFVTSHYVHSTGDVDLLREKVPFLQAEPLKPDEAERYGLYSSSNDSFSLYEHCLRALHHGSTAGPRGLPLIGSGDWNDGMNRVGVQGHGESVWLGWFLYATLNGFAPICEEMGDQLQAHSFLSRAELLRTALEGMAWDGKWYLRAFYDDGSPLGSSKNLENQIDSIAQSWAVLSGAADLDRCQIAMDSLLERLVDHENRLMLLFTPPFDQTPHDPGYIKGYLPGIRENGGQYTHGAQWAIWALAQLGRSEEAEKLFRLLNPIYHGQDPQSYQVEPYVVAADVYNNPHTIGRGGWTWYTGSAAWIYRLGLEGLLGLQRFGEKLKLDPRIPTHWPGFDITYHWGEATYSIHVDNSAEVERGVQEVSLDGQTFRDEWIPLTDDGREHEIQVVMGQ